MSADIDLPGIPSALAERLGVDVFTAGLLVSAIIVVFTVVLVAFVIKSKSGLTYGLLATELTVMGFLVALGWLPVYILIVLVLCIAIMYASTITKTLGGG